MKNVSVLPSCRKRMITSGLRLFSRDGHFISAHNLGTLTLSFRRQFIPLSPDCVRRNTSPILRPKSSWFTATARLKIFATSCGKWKPMKVNKEVKYA